MRCTYILTAFVAGAMAVPGAFVPRDDSASTTTDVSETTATSTSTGTSNTEIPSEWNKVDLDEWVRLIANETIDTSNKTQVSHMNTALDWLECYFDISDAESCQNKVITPSIKYVKEGVYYSRNFYKKLYNKHYQQLKEWKSKGTSFFETFSSHKLSASKNSTYFQYAKKAIKSWKKIFSGSSSLLGGFDISSAGLSFASGVASAVKSNVTETFQKEMSNPQNIRGAFSTTFNQLKTASISGFTASAVNTIWSFEHVFIAKASNDIDGKKPADIDLALLGDNARTCDDDGTCYFFIVAQNISNIAGNWKGAKGFDKVKEYNLTLLELAQSATWFQKEFDGYAAKPNSTDLLKSLQSKSTKPALSYFVNLPVVEYDSAKSVSSKNSSEVALLKTLTKEISGLKGWPYPKSTK